MGLKSLVVFMVCGEKLVWKEFGVKGFLKVIVRKADLS